MEFYKFNKDSGKRISKFNSDFIMSRIIQTSKVTNIGCMHLDRNGIVVSPSSSTATSFNFERRGLCP